MEITEGGATERISDGREEVTTSTGVMTEEGDEAEASEEGTEGTTEVAVTSAAATITTIGIDLFSDLIRSSPFVSSSTTLLVFRS